MPTLSITTEQSTATNKLESFLPIQASSGGSGSEYSSNYSSKYRKPPLQTGDSKGWIISIFLQGGRGKVRVRNIGDILFYVIETKIPVRINFQTRKIYHMQQRVFLRENYLHSEKKHISLFLFHFND